jgi:hypothetical protein
MLSHHKPPSSTVLLVSVTKSCRNELYVTAPLKYHFQLILVILLEWEFGLRTISLTVLECLRMDILRRSRRRIATNKSCIVSSMGFEKSRRAVTLAWSRFCIPFVTKNPKLKTLYMCRYSRDVGGLGNGQIYPEILKFVFLTCNTFKPQLISLFPFMFTSFFLANIPFAYLNIVVS